MSRKKLTKEEKEARKSTELYKYKSARTKQYTFGALSYASLVVPDLVLLGVNWSNWVITQVDTVKVSCGVVLTLLCSLFVLYKKFSKDLKFTGLTAVVGFWIGYAVVILLQSLLTQFAVILLYTCIGITTSFLLDIPSKYYKNAKLEHLSLVDESVRKKSKRASDITKAFKEASGFKDKNYIPQD